MKIAHLAEALGVDVEIHASGPAHRHCMAAIRNTSFYEVALVGPQARNPLPPVYACDYSDDLEAVGARRLLPGARRARASASPMTGTGSRRTARRSTCFP